MFQPHQLKIVYLMKWYTSVSKICKSVFYPEFLESQYLNPKTYTFLSIWNEKRKNFWRKDSVTFAVEKNRWFKFALSLTRKKLKI